MSVRTSRTSAGRVAVFLAAIVVMAAAAHAARAQEIEPNEFVPLPAGTNVILGYYTYGHSNSYSVANGPTFRKSTGVEVNVGTFRYVHFFPSLFGQPFGVQLIQTFGSESGAQLAGQSLGSAFGVQNTALSAFIFPYVNARTGTNTSITLFLYPPDGTYDPLSPINLGDNRLRGNVQLGYDQAIGSHFSATLESDVMFYGENSDYTAFGLHLDATPTYRFQAWANWRWTAAFQTSVGYEGLFGGIESVNGTRDGNRTEEQRLRAAASLFLSPRSQVLLEVNHDVEAVGGYKQAVGAQLRALYVF